MGVVIPGGGGATREDAASGANILGGSLRLDSASSQYLNRTFGTPTDNKKWTFSCWIKRSKLSISATAAGSVSLFCTQGSGAQSFFGFTNNDDNDLSFGYGGYHRTTTTGLFRDLSAWYHIILVFDSANATTADRAIIYVNGTRATVTTPTAIGLNDTTLLNSAVNHGIGRQSGQPYVSMDCYLSEINFIDGQALTPSSFGFTDPLTNTWRPKKYTGTYGTNGFYLPLDNNDAKGTDRSGNNNNWTANNFTGTFSNPDVVPDSPSGVDYSTAPTSGITTTTGITKPSNYCTLNPLLPVSAFLGGATLKNGNLQVQGTGGVSNTYGRGNMAISGKMYAEFYFDVVSSYASIGVVPINDTAANGSLYTQSTNVSYRSGGNKRVLGTESAYGASWVANDIIGVAVNPSANTIEFFKNGASQGVITSSSFFAQGDCTFGIATDDVGSPQGYANFGQRPFKYTPPAGFLSLCTANLSRSSIVRPDQHFYIHLYTGNGSTQTITGFPFQPEFTWIKERGTNVGGTGEHRLYDCVRGYSTGHLASNDTRTQTISGTINNTPNGSDPPYGLTLGTDNDLNESNTYVAWNWKAGGPIGVGRSVSINGVGYATTTAAGLTAGTIAPTGASINTKSGFSIITYTGNATSGATVSHGLGTTPAMIIIKSTTVATNWYVWHQGLTQPDYQVYLNLTNGQDTSVTTFLNDKAPTSSVFELPGTGLGSNNSGATYVAYCWAEIPGFSKFGSYTGNGPGTAGSFDGPFVQCGFRPRWILIRSTSNARDWLIYDAARGQYNPQAEGPLQPNTSGTPYGTAYLNIDILSNGFKIRDGITNLNNSGETHIYAAFAETPVANLFGGQSNAR